MSDTEDTFVDTALFEDPEDYYPPTPPPTTQTYTTGWGDVITLHLVGHSPLEAHHLWYVRIYIPKMNMSNLSSPCCLTQTG